jgi:hypothetical protein
MRTLLVGKVGVVEVGDRRLVAAAQQDASQLSAGRICTARQNQGGVTKIDKCNFAAILDPPAVPQVCGKTGLATVRYPRRRYLCSHTLAL